MERWEVLVAVGAELDLPEPVLFGPVTLGQPPQNARVQLPPDPVLPDVPGEHVVTLQQTTRIYTSTFYWVVVEAPDEDEARAKVERSIDPIVSVGLALMLGHEVPTQVLRALNLASPSDSLSAWGAGAQLTRLAQRRPDPTELTRFLSALRDNEQLQGCLPYLTRATRYQAITPTAGDLALDAALLELAKALEYLVRKTPITQRDDDGDETADRILTNLAKILSGSRGVRKKTSAVAEAARALDRRQRRTVSESVRAFANVHALSTDWTATAVRLIEVRNKNLAHPGERMSHADRAALSADPGGARSVVLDAIRAVIDGATEWPIPEAPVSRAASDGEVTIRWEPGPVASWTAIEDAPPAGS